MLDTGGDSEAIVSVITLLRKLEWEMNMSKLILQKIMNKVESKWY